MPPTNPSPVPVPDPTVMANPPSAAMPETSAATTTTTTTTTTTAAPGSVPLAPFPNDSSAQAQKGSASSFVIFNISVYTAISILIAIAY